MRIAYHALLNDFLCQLRDAFHLSSKEQLARVRELLAGRYDGLQDYTIDVQGLKAFIGRVTDTYGDESNWLLSLASFLARKPPEKWTDDDATAARYRLLEMSKKLRELETLRLHSERVNDKSAEYELVLLKSVSQSGGETECVVTLNSEKRKRLQKVVEAVSKQLNELGSEDLRNAVLAMVISPQHFENKESIIGKAAGAQLNG
jgi:hypothetical protein